MPLGTVLRPMIDAMFGQHSTTPAQQPPITMASPSSSYLLQSISNCATGLALAPDSGYSMPLTSTAGALGNGPIGRILSRMRPALQCLMACFNGSNFWKPPPLWGSYLTECFWFVGLWPTLCFRKYFILLSCYWALGPHALKAHYYLCSFIYLSKG